MQRHFWRKYSLHGLPNQVGKLRKFQGVGGIWQASAGMENPGGWGSKTKVPSVGGMDIFWNTTDRLSSQLRGLPGVGSSTLRCEKWNFTGELAGSVVLRTNLVRSWEQCCVFYLICFCFRFLITYLYRCSALTNLGSKTAESWSLIVGIIPGKDEDEMMNIWISYIWTAELNKTNEENMIIAVKDTTLRKESLNNLGFAGIWQELVIFCEVK